MAGAKHHHRILEMFACDLDGGVLKSSLCFKMRPEMPAILAGVLAQTNLLERKLAFLILGWQASTNTNQIAIKFVQLYRAQ